MASATGTLQGPKQQPRVVMEHLHTNGTLVTVTASQLLSWYRSYHSSKSTILATINSVCVTL